MANMALAVSTAFDSSIRVQGPTDEVDCMSIALVTYISDGNLYARDFVTIHGSISDMRLLAKKMLAALPQED